MSPTSISSAGPPTVVTGVQLMRGIGVRQARGFWTEALLQIIRRPGAIFGLSWLSIVLALAIVAPFIANGHPLAMTELDTAGNALRVTHPFLNFLKPTDLLLPIGALVVIAWCLIPELRSETRRARLANFCAIFAGALILAPLTMLLVGGSVAQRVQWLLPALGIAAAATLLALARAVRRGERFGTLFVAAIVTGIIVVLCEGVIGRASARDIAPWFRTLKSRPHFPLEAAATISGIIALLALALPFLGAFTRRAAVFLPVALLAAICVASTWTRPLTIFDYRDRQARGEVSAIHTLIPWSPTQRRTELNTRPPGSAYLTAEIDRITAHLPRDGALTSQQLDSIAAQIPTMRHAPVTPGKITTPHAPLAAAFRAQVQPRSDATRDEARRFLNAQADLHFHLGTDSLGQDVLSQIIHACRLAISIGLVSTGIAVLIGVTLGSLMGYFGGWVDILLSRVVEVFQAIPVLFLLIVAAAVLPRNTYIMMMIIGCVTWTGAARFIRAEFYKLRGQDFVQAARAVGLPLHSILFRHMLPNGVTPVLVDASFAVAAAILAEATLSYLGLGPEGQPSWGQLLSDATGSTGDFVWWLAIFPGAAIFLTVLSYNLIGEALRDAIDPKLKKARV